MKYLLDTQIFIWILEDNLSLTLPITKILTDNQNSFYLSTESYREIAIKYRIGKIKFTDNFSDVINTIPKQFGIKTLALKPEHLTTFASLIETEHKDPADLFIISQAISEKIILISADRNFPHYRKFGLNLIDA